MTPEDKVYVANMMRDVKETANGILSLSTTDREIFAKIELNFHRIADAITKIVS